MINSGREEIVIELSMSFDADFADLFEVKSKQLIKERIISRRVSGQDVELIYRREDFERRTIVHADGARLSQGSAEFLLRLEPAESWSETLRVSCVSVAPREKTGTASNLPVSKIMRPQGVDHRDQMDAWLDAAPIVQASWDTLGIPMNAAFVILLPYGYTPALLGAAIPAAGLPWFMAVFGRDSLITSYQALPFVPQLASATLQVLAAGRRRSGTIFETPSLARSCTNCASVNSPTSGTRHNRPTTGRRTLLHCS